MSGGSRGLFHVRSGAGDWRSSRPSGWNGVAMVSNWIHRLFRRNEQQENTKWLKFRGLGKLTESPTRVGVLESWWILAVLRGVR